MKRATALALTVAALTAGIAWAIDGVRCGMNVGEDGGVE